MEDQDSNSNHHNQDDVPRKQGSQQADEEFDLLEVVAARSGTKTEALTTAPQLADDLDCVPTGPFTTTLVEEEKEEEKQEEVYDEEAMLVVEESHRHQPNNKLEIFEATATATSTTSEGSAAVTNGHNGEFDLGPGAFPAGGPSTSTTAGIPVSVGVGVERAPVNDNNRDNNSNGGLVVANVVMEDHLPQAREYNGANIDRSSSRRRTKQFKTKLLMGVIVLLAASTVVVTLLATSGQNKSVVHRSGVTTTTTQGPPSNISQTPLSMEDYIMSLLPETTTSAIMRVTTSAQAKAIQWLLEDSKNVLSMPEERIQQKFALATLYYSTGGNASWKRTTNWMNHSVHECHWHNEPDFAVKSVVSQLYPDFMEGFLEPPPSSQCSDDGLYQHLWLDQNNLVGTLPEELYLLTSLISLSLNRNPIEGTLSSQIGKLTELQGLALASQKPDAGLIPSEIGLLTNLSFLLLPEFQFQGSVPDEVWKLTNMVDLFLFGSPQLTGTLPSQLGTFPKLRKLVMDWCSLTGTILTELGQVTTLRKIGLSHNQFTGQLPTFKAESLFFLELTSNQLSGPLPNELSQLKNMMYARLGNNLFSQSIPTQFGLLTHLQQLELSHNELAGPVPSELGSLTALGQLSLANNSLSGTLPEGLSALKESLYALNLKDNPLLSGIIPSGLCSLNGTCLGNPDHTCAGFDGLSFDCTDRLCGCGCPCV